MRKFILILTVLSLAFIEGCSTPSEGTRSFVKSRIGNYIELTYYYEGDKVTRQILYNEMTYGSLGGTKDQIREIMEQTAQGYEKLIGVEYSLEYKEDRVIERLSIDNRKANLDELSKIPGSYLISGKKGNEVSIKATEQILKNQEFTEKRSN